MTSASPADSLTPAATAHPDKNNPREIFGWKIYDWANSAFSTTIAGALYGPYLTEITQRVGENGVVSVLGPPGRHFHIVFFQRVVPPFHSDLSARPVLHRRLFK